MALLGKIRNKFGWVMTGLVLLGVFGFLFMDVSSVGRGGMGAQQRVVGTVNGQDILRDEFDAYVKDYERPGVSGEQTRAYAWNELLSDMIFRIQANKLGIQVTDKEVEDMFIGENISPIIMQQFGGQVDRATLEQQRNTYFTLEQKSPSELTEQERNFLDAWKTLEKKVIADRMASKYLNMVRKGMYSPGWMTTAEFARNGRSYDFNYVRIMYTDVPNSEVKITDDELKAYIKENPKKYEREANVSIEYVVFDVLPTAADSATYQEKMKKVAADFAVADNDTVFVQSNQGKLDYKFYTKETWEDPAFVKDSLFSMGKGSVYGPYLDNLGNYKAVKILETKTMPDSVKCRHIFMRANQRDVNELQKNYMVLDSLKKMIVDKGANFDSLALQNSMDGTRDKGGDLGWRKKGDPYGTNFEDYIFHIGKKDSVQIIQTQEGLHLIQIMDVKLGNEKGLRLASVLEPIIPSTATEDLAEAKANEFMGNNRKLENLQKAVKENTSIRRSTASGLEINDFQISEQIQGGVAAEIIKWAHKEAKVNEVAGRVFPLNDPQGNFVSQIIVPALVSKSKKGLATIDDINVKVEVEQIVRNKKKAELVRKNLQGVSSLEGVVQKYSNAKIEMANAVSYASPFIQNIGVEPKVIGMAEASELNKISAPIEGGQAVYVIQVLNRRDGAPISNIPVARKSISDRLLPNDPASLRGVFMEALKENMKIKDNRAELY